MYSTRLGCSSCTQAASCTRPSPCGTPVVTAPEDSGGPSWWSYVLAFVAGAVVLGKRG